MRETLKPSGAVAQMLQESGELDRILDGGLTFEPAPVVPAPEPPGEPLRIERPNWEQEIAERQAAEQKQQRQQRDAIITEELARLAAEDEQTYPAPRSKRRRSLRELLGRETQ